MARSVSDAGRARAPAPLSAEVRAHNLRAFSAAVARHQTSIMTGEAEIGVARDIYSAFARAGAAHGLTRAEIWELVCEDHEPVYSRDVFDARFEVLRGTALEPYHKGKKHQQRFVVNPSGPTFFLVKDRLDVRGGIDELYRLLDLTRSRLLSGTIGRDEVARALVDCRDYLVLYAMYLERLVREGSLRELIEEQGQHEHQDLEKRVEELNALVTERFRDDADLDLKAVAALSAAMAYQHWLMAALNRVIDQGTRTLDFEVLSADDYLDAARHASPALLEQVAANLVVDPPLVWVHAGMLIDALEEYAPRTRIWRRPPMPTGAGEPDPIGVWLSRRTRERERRERFADRVLLERDEVELTEQLRAMRWPQSARMLADLIQLDADAQAPYRVVFGVPAIVDSEGRVTYLHSVVLRRTAVNPKLAGQVRAQSEVHDEGE